MYLREKSIYAFSKGCKFFSRSIFRAWFFLLFVPLNVGEKLCTIEKVLVTPFFQRWKIKEKRQIKHFQLLAIYSRNILDFAKNKIKLKKTSFYLPFEKLKNIDSFNSSDRLTSNVKKASNTFKERTDDLYHLRFIVPFERSTSNG